MPGLASTPTTADETAGTPPLAFPVRDLPSVISSGDGLFAVSAPPATAGYRGPVLTFAHTVQQALQTGLRLEWVRPDRPILIVLGMASNDTSVLAARVGDAAGGERERIQIADPEHGDLDALREALVRALVREWLLAAAPKDAAARPVMVPAWLLAGLARHLGGEHRLEDSDEVYAQWSRGRLPMARDLLAVEPDVAMRHPPLQAVVAAWLYEQPDAPLRVLLRHLAEGTPWTPVLAARAFKGDPAALQASWDAWQAATVKQIRQPGTTSAAVAQAFQSQLLIYPGDYGILIPDGKRGRTFAECLELRRDAGLRAAAMEKAAHLRLFAAGRDRTLQRVAEDYAQVMDALAQGQPADQVKPLLEAADAACREMAALLEKSGVMRDPPPPALAPSKGHARGT